MSYQFGTCSRASSSAKFPYNRRPTTLMSTRPSVAPTGKASIALPNVHNQPIIWGALAGTVTSRVDIGNVNTNATDYSRGEVVRFIHLVPNLDPRAKFNDQITHAASVGTICAKVRYGVVAAILPNHLLVLPVLSSDGNGLENKPVEYRKECIPITSRDSQRYQLPGMNRMTLHPAPDCLWTPKHHSYVVTTKPYVVEYCQPIKKYKCLRQDSIDYLEQQYRIGHLKGFAAHNNLAWQDHIELHWRTIISKLQSAIDEALQAKPKKAVVQDEDGFEIMVKKPPPNPIERSYKRR